MFVERLNARFAIFTDRWLRRRLPPSKTTTLNNRKLFIFPTRGGFGWFVLLVLTWLAATNYENNLVFGFACLFTSLFVVTILATFSTLAGLTVKYVKSIPAFAGEEVMVEVLLSHHRGKLRENICCSFTHSEQVMTSLSSNEEQRLLIPVPTSTRGVLFPGRLIIESRYPLGLLRVWSKVDLQVECLVYPKPVYDTPSQVATSATGAGDLQGSDGSEDFIGLENYRVGDSLKRIAWKQYAREQGLHAKHYGDEVDEQLWLDWDAYPNHHKEARLSWLCGRLLEIAATRHCYGLKLPGTELAPNRGEQHRLAILRELALFEPGQSGVEEAVSSGKLP